MRDSFPPFTGWHEFSCRFTKQFTKLFSTEQHLTSSLVYVVSLATKPFFRNRLQRDFTLRIDRLNHNFKKNLPESNFQERQEAHGNNLGMTL